MISQFIDLVRDEKNGFSFGKPWRISENSLSLIVPIIFKNKVRRNYQTFAEAKDVFCEDTGDINFIKVINKGITPVFIGRGEIFKGNTQERAVIHGCVVLPGRSIRVAVRCIHQSKGIQQNQSVSYGGRVPNSIDLSSQDRTWSSVSSYCCSVSNTSNTDFNVPAGNRSFTSTTTLTTTQGDTGNLNGDSTVWVSNPYEISTPYEVIDGWNDSPNIYGYTESINPTRPDNLVGTLDEVTDFIKDAMSKIPKIKNQVGAIFIKENKVIGLDLYNSPLSWLAVKEAIVSKEGSCFLEEDEDSIFEFKPDKVNKLINKRLSIDFDESCLYQNKHYKVVELKSAVLDGECIIYKDTIIHLSLWNSYK